MVFESSGEIAGDDNRCPGETFCTAGFIEAAGTIEERREEICGTCKLFPTKWLIEDISADDEIEDLITTARIHYSALECKQAIDFNDMDYAHFQLVEAFKAAEREVDGLRAFRLKRFIEGFSAQ